MPTPKSLSSVREQANKLNPVIDNRNATIPHPARLFLDSRAIKEANKSYGREVENKALFIELPGSGGKKKRKSIKKRKTKRKHCQTKYKRKN